MCQWVVYFAFNVGLRVQSPTRLVVSLGHEKQPKYVISLRVGKVKE